MSVTLRDLLETTDEITEQIVKHFYPNKEAFLDDAGTLRLKKSYREMSSKIYTILNNNLNEGKEYGVQKQSAAKKRMAKVA